MHGATIKIFALCWVVGFAMSRKRANSPDLFSYSCGQFTPKSQTKSITPTVKKAFELYFGCKVSDQDYSWATHSCCSRCSRYLRCWLIDSHQSVPFAVPVVWRKQKDHLTEGYLCLTKLDGHNWKSESAIVYPNIPSAIRPVEHDH